MRGISARTHRAFALPRGRGDFLRQLAIWFGFGVAYQIARGLADRSATEAFANANRVVRLEERFGAFVEPDVQRPVLQTGGVLLHAVDWTYWLSQFTVVGLALLWIYLCRHQAYVWVRNTIIVTNAIGLVGYVAMPTAPPRLLPELGFTDTLGQSEWLNHGTGLVVLASNLHAAMPSLHAADALIIGFALATLVRPRFLKPLFAVWPAWVAFSLIASGNHFWLDIAAGAVLAAVGAWVARRIEGWRPAFLYRLSHVPAYTHRRPRPRQNRSGFRGFPDGARRSAGRHFNRVEYGAQVGGTFTGRRYVASGTSLGSNEWLHGCTGADSGVDERATGSTNSFGVEPRRSHVGCSPDQRRKARF